MSKTKTPPKHPDTLAAFARVEAESPRINADVVNGLIREAFDRTDEEETLRIGRECAANLSDEQILAIASGAALLVGVTPDPIRFVAGRFVRRETGLTTCCNAYSTHGDDGEYCKKCHELVQRGAL